MTRTFLVSDLHMDYKILYMPLHSNTFASSSSYLNAVDNCLARWAGTQGIAAEALTGLLNYLDSLSNSRKCDQASLPLARQWSTQC